MVILTVVGMGLHVGTKCLKTESLENLECIHSCILFMTCDADTSQNLRETMSKSHLSKPGQWLNLNQMINDTCYTPGNALQAHYKEISDILLIPLFTQSSSYPLTTRNQYGVRKPTLPFTDCVLGWDTYPLWDLVSSHVKLRWQYSLPH